MTTTTLAVLVPLLPFLGAVAGLLLGRRVPGLARPLAVLPTLLATVLAVLVAARQDGGAAVKAATELTPTGNDALGIQLAINLDGFAALVAVLVGVVATCVQLYSTGYLRDDPRYASYAALVSLFTAAMLLVVYSDDLIVLLVGWEVMGICSYFLVGHYWETHAARAASLKAFLVTKLGDVPFLIGIFALASDAGTFRISDIVTRLTSSVSGFELAHPTVVALLLLAGVAGKSAQFPLHVWLPDAMAGPTPVSALIHAATMVAAGVYFVARLLPVFAASGAAMVVLAVIAAVTMVGSALAALAVADRGAAVFHLISHGAFKALLFLAAGVIIHVAGTNSLATIGRSGGIAKRAPDAFWTMTIGLFALAALPPFAGFFSKEAVLGAAEHAAFAGGGAEGRIGGAEQVVPASAGWIVLVAGLITALLTAAYATRLWLRIGPLARREEARPPQQSTAAEPAAAEHTVAEEVAEAQAPEVAAQHHDGTPLVMNIVLWVLAAPSLASGLAFAVLPEWFDGGSLAPTLATSVLATGVALVGVVVTYAAWRHTTALAAARAPLGAVAAHPGAGPAASEAEAIATPVPVQPSPTTGGGLEPDPADPGRLLLGPLHGPAADGFRVDVLGTALFVRPAQAAARLVQFLDSAVVDTYVRGAGGLPRLLGTLVRRAQTGNVQTYLTVLLAGSVVLAVAAVLAATGGAGA